MASGKKETQVEGVIIGSFPTSLNDASSYLISEFIANPSYLHTSGLVKRTFNWQNASIGLSLAAANVNDSRREHLIEDRDNYISKKTICFVVYDVENEGSLEAAKEIIKNRADKGEGGAPINAVLIGYANSKQDQTAPQVRELGDARKREEGAKKYAEAMGIPYAEINAPSSRLGEPAQSQPGDELNAALAMGITRYFEIYPEENPKNEAKRTPASAHNWSFLSFIRNHHYAARVAAPTVLGIPLGAITWVLLNKFNQNNIFLFDSIGHSIGMGSAAGLFIGVLWAGIAHYKDSNNNPSYSPLPVKYE